MDKEMENQEKAVENDRIAALEQQVQTLMTLLQAQAMGNQYSSQKEDKVTIVNLVERVDPCTTYIELTNLVISMRKLGEERSLTVQQFEELVSKYRGWFDQGIIAVGAGYEELAHKYGLDTVKKYPMKSDFIQSLATISMSQLEEIYPRLPEAGKESVITYWLRKAHTGDPNFRDIRKLETLNRLSNGQFSQYIGELNAAERQNRK